MPTRSGFLTDFLNSLRITAKLHGSSVIYTDQISTNPVSTAYTSAADQQKPCGGPSVEHKPTYKLFFRVALGNSRIVRMMDSSKNELCERAFVINDKGIDDLPVESIAGKRYASTTQKFDQKQSQEVLIKKTKNAEEVTANDIAEAREATEDEKEE
jgi:hypothetical protein